jgi:hypothetical protein
MADDASDLSQDDIAYYANRPSPEYDEVVLQADYAARAAISFYRFRQLGGGRNGTTPETRMKFGKSTGRGIHYVSDHPQVRILNLSVIALLILFESAANAYFFAQQSEFGISGGIFQAAAVSLANVATSYFIIGFWGLRHASIGLDPNKSLLGFDSRNVTKAFGIVAVIMGIIIVLLVNLSAAHYRNLLDLKATLGDTPGAFEAFNEHTSTIPRFLIDSDICQSILQSPMGESIGSAATNAMCRPFALHSLDAMVLFALGLAISAIAAFEGRKADAAFPGFSDAARGIERSRRDLQDALDDYYDSYEDALEDAEEDFGRLTPKQKVSLRRAMDARVSSFRRLLETDPDIMRDEFDVPEEVVEHISGKKPKVMPRRGNDS